MFRTGYIYGNDKANYLVVRRTKSYVFLLDLISHESIRKQVYQDGGIEFCVFGADILVSIDEIRKWEEEQHELIKYAHCKRAEIEHFHR